MSKLRITYINPSIPEVDVRITVDPQHLGSGSRPSIVAILAADMGRARLDQLFGKTAGGWQTYDAEDVEE